MKIKFTRRRVLLAVLLILIIFFGRPVVFLTYNYWKDHKDERTEHNGYANDASRMNETKEDSIVHVANATVEAEKQLQQLVNKAVQEGKKISIAGSQHSMGGHTIYPGGILLDMRSFNRMQLDSANNILTVGAGATWAEIIPYLDKYNRSVAVMQSNNSFTVGGSISVNCHGWQPNTGPIASTVEGFRILTADGIIQSCSRTGNKELFSLALGGYGLFGVILEVQLKVVANRAYRMYQFRISAEDYIKEFDKQVNKGTDVGMAYGRININPDNLLNEAMLTIFKTDTTVDIPPLKEPGFSGIRRVVFRSSANSDYGKKLRWRMEKLASWFSTGKLFSRNQLINEPVEVFQNTTPGYSDILHEYFIPADSVNSFIKGIKEIVPQYRVDLLNITVRNVLKDNDVFLHYAPGDVFGFVMLFNQATTKEGEIEMQGVTRKMIDLAISNGGSYYLPYRLHASREQFYKAYPAATQFFAMKRKYDPQEIFQNQFYITYK